jgi:general secretion pathway protein A
MDFLHFFGLREDPFKLTPDPAYFYPSSSHNEGLLLLDYSTEQKEGFVLLIGDPGTGKTTLLNVFLEKWKEKAEIAIILTPRLSPEEFLVSVIEDLNIKLDVKNKNEIIKAFRDFMVEKSLQGKRIVIVVDEAQNLPDETLEELRLLSNLETDKEKLIQIILIGQPELEKRLVTDKLKQLNQRITTRIHLKHFNREETLDYINARLIKAGRKNLKIHSGAKRLIHRLSHGTPRLINMLMSRALMAAYLEERHMIVPKHIRHAVKSLDHSEIKEYARKRLSPAFLTILLLLTGVGITGYLLINSGYLYSIKWSKPVQGEPAPLRGFIKNGNVYNVYEPEKEICEGYSDTGYLEQETPLDEKSHSFKFISIKVDGADIRDGPSFSSKEVGWTSKGSSFVVLNEAVDSENVRWYQILHRGKKRWVSEKYVDVVEE